ncbi:hypothetical protein [Alteraurantiacibacter aquimixticola]|uniref:Glycosyltransferase RgtA/B/C/D-like domain-containing protein n=1 Tax=Alteraurantiacibacter aquimixticola TaxID=2489173 RepID=A0A4T3F3P6_9SPHN|nr:hypothetical protein [Alteraurantiacibacter aquimixticola]TIX51843.1 hypothetical protein E5222_05210 [Alteraurantiacibacter aquimixticola]
MTAAASLGRVAQRWFARWPAQLAWFLAFALLTRFTMLGDPNYQDDEALFFLIGQGWVDGAWPYADMWDRKGPGLFLLFAGFAAISDSVLSYQIGALAFAALTAFTVNRIAFLFTGRLGAMLAGTLYLAQIPLFMGGGGQAAVFFNLPIAVAAWLVLSAPHRALPSRGMLAAMLLAGVAATFKQTCLFDGIFLGSLLLWRHWRAGASVPQLARNVAQYAFLGALPILLFFGAFGLAGHLAELWHALVWSNLDKSYNPANNITERVVPLVLIISPVIPLVAATLALGPEHDGKRPLRGVLALWLLVVLASLIAVPNFIDHYMLPVVLVTSICAAPALQKEPVGPLWGFAAILGSLLFGPAFQANMREQSRSAMAQVNAEIAAQAPQPRLFVFQGPVALYAGPVERPPSPLIFPLHLYYAPERDTSYLPTAGEVRRILAWRPHVVVTFPEQPDLADPELSAMVMSYVEAHCSDWGTRDLPDRYGVKSYRLWGDCAAD